MIKDHYGLFFAFGCIVCFVLGYVVKPTANNAQLDAIIQNLTKVNTELSNGLKLRVDLAAIGGTPVLLMRSTFGNSIIGTGPDNATDDSSHPLYMFNYSYDPAANLPPPPALPK